MDIDKLLMKYLNGELREVLEFARRKCIKCIRDIPHTSFKKGMYYEIEDNKGGTWIKSDSAWYDIYDEEFDMTAFDMTAFVFGGKDGINY